MESKGGGDELSGERGMKWEEGEAVRGGMDWEGRLGEGG